MKRFLRLVLLTFLVVMNLSAPAQGFITTPQNFTQSEWMNGRGYTAQAMQSQGLMAIVELEFDVRDGYKPAGRQTLRYHRLVANADGSLSVNRSYSSRVTTSRKGSLPPLITVLLPAQTYKRLDWFPVLDLTQASKFKRPNWQSAFKAGDWVGLHGRVGDGNDFVSSTACFRVLDNFQWLYADITKIQNSGGRVGFVSWHRVK